MLYHVVIAGVTWGQAVACGIQWDTNGVCPSIGFPVKPQRRTWASPSCSTPKCPPPFRGRGGRVSVGLDLATVSANTEISRGAFLIPVLSFSSHSPSFNPFDCTGPLGAELCRDRRNRVGLPESGVRAEAPLCAQTSKKTERLDPRALHVWATGTASISMVKIVLTIDRSTYIPATTRMHVCG